MTHPTTPYPTPNKHRIAENTKRAILDGMMKQQYLVVGGGTKESLATEEEELLLCLVLAIERNLSSDGDNRWWAASTEPV